MTLTTTQIKMIHTDEVGTDALQSLLGPAADLLKKGGVIAYPTETVYGLGANIFRETAVRRLFDIKRRDPGKPFSVMIASVAAISVLCTGVSENARKLMEKYWPGPLTLVLRASREVPHHIQSGDGKIGLRIPDHPVTAALMKSHPEPVTTTSANLSGEPACISAGQVSQTLHENVDLIIDGGRCDGKLPSTVVDLSGKRPLLLRQGIIPFSGILTTIQKG